MIYPPCMASAYPAPMASTLFTLPLGLSVAESSESGGKPLIKKGTGLSGLFFAAT